MIYLASPYTHKHLEIMDCRYEFTMEVTAHLIKLGYPIFSPIVHCHAMAKKYSLPVDYPFWKKYSESCIVSCESMLIAAIDGWAVSIGVRSEYNFAIKEGKQVGIVIHSEINGNYTILEKLALNPFVVEDIKDNL